MGLNVLGHSIYGIIILMMARPAVRIVDTLTLSFGDFRKQCNGEYNYNTLAWIKFFVNGQT